MLEANVQLQVTSKFLLKFVCPNNGEDGTKIDFIENVWSLNFFCNLICTNPVLEKFGFLNNEPKCS